MTERCLWSSVSRTSPQIQSTAALAILTVFVLRHVPQR
jgi:hypothetical protein